MERLFIFLYAYRAFFTFLILELACAWMIIENNQYQGAQFFNSSNSAVASLNNFSQGVREYFLLRKINSTLADENAHLRSQLEKYKQAEFAQRGKQITDSLKADSTVISQYDFISAKVVSNTVNRFTNFLTINKGSADQLSPGMAVISTQGAVGKIKSVSEHFSVVKSILHIDVRVSALLTRTGHLGTIKWNGRNPDLVQLEYIPRHVVPVKGDTVVTSGYSAVYPEGIMIGTVEEVVLREESLVYDLTVRLSQDFRKLSFVEVVRNHLKHEQDSIAGPYEEAEIK
jgi:rod shape-determining protein MreC